MAKETSQSSPVSYWVETVCYISITIDAHPFFSYELETSSTSLSMNEKVEFHIYLKDISFHFNSVLKLQSF